MVYSGGEMGARVRGDVAAMGPERSKPPLHNFNLPFLKWGTQRLLRCVKVSDDDYSAGIKENGVDGNRTGGFRGRRSSPPKKLVVARNYDVRRFKFPNARIGGGGGGEEEEEEEGIGAVGEKIMLDLRTEAEKMKDAFFRKELSAEDDELEDVRGHEEEEEEEVVEDEEEEFASRRRKVSASPPRKTESSAAAAAAAVVVEMDPGVMPWNLRTRRAAFKAPNGGGNSVPAKGLKIEERRLSSPSPLRTDTAKSPRLKGEKEKEKQKERPKFAVALSKKEIEEDFMAILRQRPARRPKKRPRLVQKQLDTLFPGLWLTEVTADMYKVAENPDNAKR